jgi:hypothetical protein
MRFVAPLALLLVGAAPLACYRPAIVDGKLKCNVDAGVGHACPEGFKCDLATQLCWKHPDAGGVDMGGDTDGSGDADGPTTDVDSGPICIVQPDPNCAPGAGTCDPACQSGCPNCTQKCSVNTAGSLTCNAPRMQGYPRNLLESCTIESGNSQMQTDNCGAGMVCIEDGCFPRCFKFCKKDADCTNTSCSRDVGGGQKVCDVPWVDACTPLGGGSNSGCTGTNMACYISSATPVHTICDCPQGGMPANLPCTKTRDCFPGLACVDRGGAGFCTQVCRLSRDAGSDCLGNQACHPYTGFPPGQPANSRFGYCL